MPINFEKHNDSKVIMVYKGYGDLVLGGKYLDIKDKRTDEVLFQKCMYIYEHPDGPQPLNEKVKIPVNFVPEYAIALTFKDDEAIDRMISHLESIKGMKK